MKVLFLDFDGVLNSDGYLFNGRQAREEYYRSVGQGDHARKLAELDPIRIQRLNKIFDEVPDLQIVISSAWRVICTIGEIKHLLKFHGFKHYESIIDRTPGGGDGIRGHQIRDWIIEKGNVSNIAIVDDADDMDPYKAFLVQTKWNGGDRHGGLQNSHIDDIIDLLKSEPFPFSKGVR